MATKHGRASEATAAPEDEETIYPSMDGHRVSVQWRLRDYEEKGALSSDERALLTQRFDLSRDLVDELSVLVGNSLDIDSAVNLVAVD